MFQSGQCGCLGYDLSAESDDWQTIYYNSSLGYDDIVGDYDDETKRLVVAEVCSSTIYLGEHMHVSFFLHFHKSVLSFSCLRVFTCSRFSQSRAKILFGSHAFKFERTYLSFTTPPCALL